MHLTIRVVLVKKCALNRGYVLIRGVRLTTDQYGNTHLIILQKHLCTSPLRHLFIRQHGSAVYVGMVVVVCML